MCVRPMFWYIGLDHMKGEGRMGAEMVVVDVQASERLAKRLSE